MKKKNWIILLSSLVLVVALVVGGILFFRSSRADEISQEQAQTLINDAFDNMITGIGRDSIKYIHDHATVRVESMEYGLNKDIQVKCKVDTIDTQSAVEEHLDEIMQVSSKDENGRAIVSTKLKVLVDQNILPYLQKAAPKTEELTLSVYQVGKDYQVYTSDDVVEAYTGGCRSLIAKVRQMKEIQNEDGTFSTVDTNLRNAVEECLSFTYDKNQPTTGNAVVRWLSKMKAKFNLNFVQAHRYQYLTRGMANTLKITFFAVILGIVLGFLIAIVRSSHDKLKDIPPRSYFGRFWLNFFNGIAQIYLTVIRGTPVVVQLMIIYYVIFASADINKLVVASLAFGLNSAAYVAEIVRSGIMSIDGGQLEAGRSLGLNYVQTMTSIILPQAFKTVLPALANEFIVLLKETSVSGYIAIQDLTKGGDIIRSRTYDAFMPLIAVALIYLVAVMILSWLVSKLERRLRKSDRG